MPFFKKKPVVIEAMRVSTPDEAVEVYEWVERGGGQPRLVEGGREGLLIETLEGDMHARLGWWVIKGVKGEHYPCDPDIFEATYQPVNEPG